MRTRTRRVRVIGGALLVTCLLIGAGAALAQSASIELTSLKRATSDLCDLPVSYTHLTLPTTPYV